MKDYVRERRLRSREMFVPLVHSPGHAQAGFGEAMAVIGGVARKVHFLAFDLPHSDACFVKAYPAETTEAFCDGHNAAVAFFGGVPRSILYDNTKLAVARILGDGKRQRTRVFTELQSHYLFEDRFGRPGKGNDKGKVEGLVGFIRRNFLVPVPRAESFAALNDALAEQCRRRQAARLRGHKETIGERLARDREAFLPLPPAPYDACDKRPGRVSSLSLVRCRGNDYSVPVAYGHREVLIRCYVDEVVISCGAEVIARHRRSYDSEDLIFDPLHYLPLIEQKIGALDQAAPLAGWDLPEAFITLRRLLEARMGKAGKREYVQVLRLLETFRLEEVEGDVQAGVRAIGAQVPHLGQVEHLRKHAEGAVAMVGRLAHAVMQLRDVASLDFGHLSTADLRLDEELDRSPVLRSENTAPRSGQRMARSCSMSSRTVAGSIQSSASSELPVGASRTKSGWNMAGSPLPLSGPASAEEPSSSALPDTRPASVRLPL